MWKLLKKATRKDDLESMIDQVSKLSNRKADKFDKLSRQLD